MGNIIWLASYPKSGNTWLRAFLNNLFADAARPLPLSKLGGSELSASSTSPHWYRLLDPRPQETWTPEEIDRMRPRVQQLIAGSRQGSVFCKTHAVLGMIRGAPTINMQVTAGAIYVVRDPRDVVLSFADFQDLPVDAAIAAMATPNLELPNDDKQVNDPIGSWSQHVESWTRQESPQLHVMRYEDMLATPEQTFGRLVAFLKVPCTPQRLKRSIRHASFETLQALEERDGFVERAPSQERFFRSGRAGQWREALDDAQVARIVAAHEGQMRRFGYLPDGA